MLSFLTRGLYDDIDDWLDEAEQPHRLMMTRRLRFTWALRQIEEIGRPAVRGANYDVGQDLIERYLDPATPVAWKRRFERLLRIWNMLQTS
ncbi:hypothetical protein IWX50DRAFT_654855 [Phyllosticta citricarpa]